MLLTRKLIVEYIVYNGFKPGHSAIDIHIESGTNILAAESGTVFYTGWGSTQGNYVIIHHGAYWTLYLHNSFNLANKGDSVSLSENKKPSPRGRGPFVALWFVLLWFRVRTEQRNILINFFLW
jgi:hypothetical protein